MPRPPTSDTSESQTVVDGPSVGDGAGTEAIHPGPDRDAIEPPPPASGTQLDRYVILDTLGKGGMGVVLRAYDPRLQREVALKRLRSRVLDDIGSERLVREAQAMAQLAHPNVVAVYDVVRSESDVLLAMEMVEGRTMTRWLAKGSPSRAEILDVFVQAGRGLAAAHAAGLVHRDFKPDNVLVGDDGRVRVTDFGLARPSRKGSVSEKAAASQVSARMASISGSHDSLRLSMTATGMVMGTPAYMAPEQHLGAEADAKADQYAFCVSLWQALTGHRPFRGEYREVTAAKAEGPPPWPREASVPRRIGDAVVRGLDPRPSARWPTMDALLAVLERDSSRARLRWTTAAALGVASVATIGAVAGWWDRTPTVCAGAREHLDGVWDPTRRAVVAQALRATGVDYAEATRAEVERHFDTYAEQWVTMHTQTCEATSVRGEQSAAVLDLRMTCLRHRLNDLDAAADVIAQAAPSDTAVVEGAISLAAGLPPLRACADVEALEAAVPPPDDPALARAVEAARREIARASAAANVGKNAEALLILDQIPQTVLAYAPMRAELELARGLQLLELRRYDEAEAPLTDATYRALEVDHRKTAIEALSALGFLLGARLLREQEGLWLVRTALAMAEAAHDDVLLAVILNDYGGVLQTHAHHEQSLAQFQRGLALHRGALGHSHPSVLTSTTNVATALQNLGDFEQSMALRREALGLAREIFGDEHPRVAMAMYLIANVLHQQGEYEQAADLFERALMMQRRLLGPERPETAHTLGELGLALSSLGRHADAEAKLRESLALLQRHMGPDQLEVIDTLNNLAVVIDAQGRHEEALVEYRTVLGRLERQLGPEHPRTGQALNNVSGALTTLRRYEEALPLLQRALEIQTEAFGEQHPLRGIYLINLGEALIGLERYDQAQQRFLEAAPLIEAGFGPDHVYMSYVKIGLGRTHLSQGRRESARPLLERGLALREQPGVPQTDRAEAEFLVAQVLDEDERARARVLAERARTTYAAAGADHTVERAQVDAWLRAHPG